jgi:membrane-associated phospholipid phosphatase
LLVLAGCVAAPFDVRVAEWITAGECPDVLEKLACLAEAFAHGFGAAAVLLTVYLLDPRRRKYLVRLAVMSLGVGAVTDFLKLFLARHRPYHFNFVGDTWATFGQWLPGWSAGAGWQSFPSSHSAVAAGLAIGLGWLYPRGRWLFMVFAGLAMFQRVVVKAHFLSDVLWGGGAGCILAGLCLSAACSRRFHRFEADGTERAGAEDPVRRLAPRDDARAA